MWQPKQPASEVVATRSFLAQRCHSSGRTSPDLRALAWTRRILQRLCADRAADRSGARRWARRSRRACFRITPTGQTCMALSVSAMSVSSSRPDSALTIRCLVDAAPGEGEHVLAVHLAGGAHAQLAQDAAVEVEQDVRMRGIHRPIREEVAEAGGMHSEVIAQRLQLAVAALLAGRAEVVALDEQHLHQGAAQCVRSPRCRFPPRARPAAGSGAGAAGAAVDLHRAQLAAAVRLELRVVAQMRNVDARRPVRPA